MNSFKQHLQSQGKSRSTIEAYGRYLLDFIAYLDRDNTEVEQATAKEVLAYLNILQKRGQENKTRGTRLSVIKQFFNWQVSQEQRTDNPISHLKIRGTKRQKLYPILSKQDLDKIYTAYTVPRADDAKSNRNWFDSYRLAKQRNKVILSLLIHQGITTSEVAKLSVNDLKLKDGKIHIAGSRKSNDRTLDLKSNQIMSLMDYQYTIRKELLKYQVGQDTDRLFLPTPIAGKSQAVERPKLEIWKSIVKDIRTYKPGFINFKQVRASVITHWLKQYNLREVQYMSGHRYVSSTEAYLVNQIEDLQSDVDMYHPF